MSIHLTWSMTLEEKRVRIDYEVANDGEVSVQLVDRLLWQRDANPDIIIVRNSSLPGTVALTRAYVMTKTAMIHTPFPTVRILDPGASHRDRAYAPWPLRAWHNFAPSTPLAPNPTSAVLEIGYIDSASSVLEALELPSGVAYTASGFGMQKLVSGDVKPLPTKT